MQSKQKKGRLEKEAEEAALVWAQEELQAEIDAQKEKEKLQEETEKAEREAARDRESLMTEQGDDVDDASTRIESIRRRTS